MELNFDLCHTICHTVWDEYSLVYLSVMPHSISDIYLSLPLPSILKFPDIQDKRFSQQFVLVDFCVLDENIRLYSGKTHKKINYW